MAADSSEAAVPEQVPGTGAESQFAHGTALVRATALDLAILAGHLLLYPTGILPERGPGASPGTGHPSGETPASDPCDAPGPTDAAARSGPSRLPTEGRAHPPVLLLHGLVDNRSAFTLLRRSLLRHGWTRVQAINHSPLICDIRTAADLLARHVEQTCEESGHSRVDLVGHSLGG
ncbi:MAG TPA: hypothetical protein VGL02_05515, partial [Streptomyces sp.]